MSIVSYLHHLFHPGTCQAYLVDGNQLCEMGHGSQVTHGQP
jgi:hypothetical protein